MLVERRALSRDQLGVLLERERAERVPLARLLAGEGVVAERDLLAALGAQAGYRFVDVAEVTPQASAEQLLPGSVAWAREALPIALEGGGVLVAMADPSDADAVAAVAGAIGLPVTLALAARGDLRRALAASYGTPHESGRQAGAGTRAPDTGVAEPAGAAVEELQAEDFLAQLVEQGGSDLHLTAGIPPAIRLDGRMVLLSGRPVLSASDVRRMVYEILTQRQRERFEEARELDMAHSVPGLGRFRVNVFLQRDAVGAVFRFIPYRIQAFDELGLPASVLTLAELPRGLVLVTGPTGSGKSTTLASLVDRINAERPVHIMTVEDPIEFMHTHKRAVVNQREVGEDTKSFAEALRHVLRQDPDVILVGEMRDLETISAALTAAETGHLVLGTLHTQDAPQAVDRVIDVFPPSQQSQIRVQLAAALQGIVTQQLVPLASGRGRIVASEVMVATSGVRNLIREAKTHQLYSAMQAGGQHGMQTMDMSLAYLVRQSKVSMPAALECCVNPNDLRRLVATAA